MPRYNYIAKSQPTQVLKGEIEAASEQDALTKLSRMGYFPISLEAEHIFFDKQNALSFRRISKRDILNFSSQLSSLIASGVNILNSLNLILKQTSNRYLKAILSDVTAKIKDGRSLSESLKAYPQYFSDLYTAMIHSGELSGNIEQSLNRLSDFLEKEEEFKNSLRAALIYPFFIFVLSIFTIVILLGFVIPRLAAMFSDLGQILPLPTKILISLSTALRSYWWLLVALIFIFVFFLRRLLTHPASRILVDKFKLKVPLVGIIILKSQISHLSRTLSLLISSGIPIVYSLEISGAVLESQLLRQEVQKFKEQIAAGLSFSKCLHGSIFFPEFVANIVTVGEETGSIETSLLRIADEYERETDRSLKTISRLLEPVIILGMGLVVGFIVLAMLLPIFQINLIVR